MTAFNIDDPDSIAAVHDELFMRVKGVLVTRPCSGFFLTADKLRKLADYMDAVEAEGKREGE